MSSTVSSHPPGGLHREPEPMSARDRQKVRALGLTSATGLVIGSIVGTGVFTMPAVLAGAGRRYHKRPRRLSILTFRPPFPACQRIVDVSPCFPRVPRHGQGRDPLHRLTGHTSPAIRTPGSPWARTLLSRG